MKATMQAIMRARATPWLLLVVTLAATAILAAPSRRRGEVSPRLEELSQRIDGRARDYVRGLELIVSGDPILGEDLLASATDRMIVLAEECVRTEGCDVDVFVRALRAAVLEQHIVVHEPRRSEPAVVSSPPPAEEPHGDEPATPAPPATPIHEAGAGRHLDLEQAIVLNAPVKHALSDWLTWNRPQLAEAYENYLFLRDQIAPIYEKAGLPEALLFALMAQETGGKVHAYSSAGAAGPLQFMPATGRRYGLARVSGFDMRLDPVASTRASAAYLTGQLRRFGNDLPKALAAYNAGESRLAALHRQLAGMSFWDTKVSDAMPPETRGYVPAVIAAAWIFLHADDYGLAPSAPEVGTTTIALKEPVSIGELTLCLGAEHNRNGWFRTLRNLNPRLSGSERIDAGEKIRMPSMLVPSYVEQCAGESTRLARARDLHDAADDKPLDEALQDDGGT